MNNLKRLFALAATSLAITSLAGVASAQEWSGSEWWPVTVTDTQTDQEIEYIPLEEAEKDWNICVLFPHVKDLYWTAVNYGVIDEARRLGAKVTLFEAGGYENVSRQLSQFDDCMALGADAIILGAISEAALAPKLRQAQEQGVIVVGVINAIADAPVAGYVDSDYRKQAYAAGRHLVDAVKDREGPVNAVAFPGPQAAYWANEVAEGFKEAIDGTNVELLEVKYGDTGKTVQLRLIEDALQTYDDIDALFVVSAAAEVAPDVLEEAQLDDVLVMGWTATKQSVNHVREGRMLGETTEMPVIMARIATDMTVRALEGKDHPYHVQPSIQILTQENLESYDMTRAFAPDGWKTTFAVE